ncbi:MAG: class I SAM-dependent methyltransferase [Bacteroidia bacterium]
MYATHSACLLCNSDCLVELENYQHAYLVQCQKCNFVFGKRIPETTELIAHYQKYKRGGEISAITIKRYEELLDAFEKYRKTNKILDIGCGDGYFLEVAKKRGWQTFGTEFTDEAMETCVKKGITIHQGILNSANYSKDNFDVITSFEVIEHINNPQSELENIREILRLGGLFYFTTPNFNSISRLVLKQNWNVIEYPEHLSYYTPKTINVFFQKNNFRKIKLDTTGISIKRFKKSIQKNNFSNAQVDEDQELRGKIEQNILLKVIKNSINTLLSLFKMGDSIKGFYEKKI